MSILLGVDPGSRKTGYGCVEMVGKNVRPITHGTLRLFRPNDPTTKNLEDRLLRLFQELGDVIKSFTPKILVVEKVFFAKNPLSALQLGQTRGVVLLTGKFHGLDIVEYNPTEVKKAISGYGRADKNQIAKSIRFRMKGQDPCNTVPLGPFSSLDASDGMALALCHALNMMSCALVPNSGQPFRETPFHLSYSALKSKTKRKYTLAESVSLKKK